MRRDGSRAPARKAAIVLAGLAAGAALGSVVRRLRRGKGGGVLMAADVKQIAKKLFEEPWKGNLNVIDEYVDESYVGYDPSLPEPLRGPQAFKEFVQGYLNAFPDGAIKVDEQYAEGDVVATRWTGRGTHKGELLGIAPTGKEVTVAGLSISKFRNGKLVEDWANWDTLGMLQQIGAVPAMATA